MKHIFDYIRKHKFLIFIIVLGFIFHMMVIMPSGSNYCYEKKCGLYFWGANIHDGIWHLSLAAASFNNFPFIASNFAGGKLIGYNYLSDFFIYLLTFIKIPILFSYFKFIPIIWFVSFTYLIIKLGGKINKSSLFITLFIFFSYFGSSFTYLLTLFHKRTFWGSSGLLSIQSGQMLENMPYAISLVFILALLILVKKDKYDLKTIMFIGLIIFINLGLKFYAGVISIFITTIFIFFGLINKINFFVVLRNSLLILLWSVFGIFLFYDPFSSIKTGSIFIFSPFATMHAIIEEPALFYLRDMVNARYYLYENGSLLNSPRLLFIELFSCILFLFFTLGLRVLGFISLIIKAFNNKLKKFDVIIFLTMIFSYLFFIFFIQKGDWWNTYQFYFYFLFFLNILTAEFLCWFLKNKKQMLKIAIILLIILITLPSNLDIIRSRISFSYSAYISKEEIEALRFIKNLPNGVIFAPIYDKLPIMTLPNTLYKVQDTSYVSALSGKQTYLNDLNQIKLIGFNYEKRLKKINSFDCKLLNEIKYAYFINEKDNKAFVKCLSINKAKVIFNNSLITIYQI